MKTPSTKQQCWWAVGGYDTKSLAQDVWRLMRDVLVETRFFIVGHHWGGPTAFALAAQNRHRRSIYGMQRRPALARLARRIT